MQRLTKYEILVLLGAILLALTAVVGYLTSVSPLFDFSLVALLLLVIIAVMLSIVRIDRVLTGQKRAREEIYQVLYSLHGNDKWTETQARKTRDLIRDNHEALMSEIRKVEASHSPDEATVENSDASGSVTQHEEAERLRFNKLMGILDAQWSLLEELRQSVPPQ